VLDRFLHDVQTQTVYPTTGDAKRASEAVDDIINNVNLIDELNVSIMLTSYLPENCCLSELSL
jgi:hypothetical protein